MRKNVSYAEITCDICGKVEQILQTQSLPKDWKRAEIPQIEYSFNSSYELCPDCVKKLNDAISSLKGYSALVKSYEPLCDLDQKECDAAICGDNTPVIVTGGCVHNNVEQDWDFCK